MSRAAPESTESTESTEVTEDAIENIRNNARELIDIDVESEIRTQRKKFADFSESFLKKKLMDTIKHDIVKLNENPDIMSCIYGGRAWENFADKNSSLIDDYNKVAFLPGNVDIMILVNSTNTNNTNNKPLFDECRQIIKMYMEQIVDLFERLPITNQIKQLYQLKVIDTVGEVFKERTFSKHAYSYGIELHPRNILNKNRALLTTRTKDWFGDNEMAIFYCELGWQSFDVANMKSIFFDTESMIYPSPYGLFIINSTMGQLVRKDKGINIDKMRRETLKQCLCKDELEPSQKTHIQDVLYDLIQTFNIVFEPKDYTKNAMITYLFENYDASLIADTGIVKFTELEKILMNHSLNNTPLRKLLQLMIIMLRNAGYNIAVSGGDALQRYIDIPLSDIDTKMMEPHMRGKIAVFMGLCVINQIINTNMDMFEYNASYNFYFGSRMFNIQFNTARQTYFSLVRALFKFYVPLISLTLRYNYIISYDDTAIVKNVYTITPFDCAFVKKKFNFHGGLLGDDNTLETSVMTYDSLYEDLVHTHETFSTKMGRNFANKVLKDYERIEQLNALKTHEITRNVGQMSLNDLLYDNITLQFMQILYIILTDNDFLIKLEPHISILPEAYSEYTIAEQSGTNIEYKLPINTLRFTLMETNPKIIDMCIESLKTSFYQTTTKHIHNEIVIIRRPRSRTKIHKRTRKNNIIIKRTRSLENILTHIRNDIEKTVNKNVIVLRTPILTRKTHKNIPSVNLLPVNKLKTLTKYLNNTRKKTPN